MILQNNSFSYITIPTIIQKSLYNLYPPLPSTFRAIYPLPRRPFSVSYTPYRPATHRSAFPFLSLHIPPDPVTFSFEFTFYSLPNDLLSAPTVTTPSTFREIVVQAAFHYPCVAFPQFVRYASSTIRVRCIPQFVTYPVHYP